MESLAKFSPLFQAIFAFSAVLTVLSIIFHWLLSPIKENQVRIEADMKQFQVKIEADIEQLKSNQEELRTDIKLLLSRNGFKSK